VPEKFKTKFTHFLAWGKVADRTPELFEQLPGGLFGPERFVSNEGTILGRVRFEGWLGLEELFGMLNAVLNITDEKGRGKDFRRVYKNWGYRYSLRERVAGGASRIVYREEKGSLE
jgi:hypothetical protein